MPEIYAGVVLVLMLMATGCADLSSITAVQDKQTVSTEEKGVETDTNPPKWRRSGTDLHWAAFDGQQNKIRELLNKGMPIDSRDRNQWTPLHWASMANRLETVELLIDRGANINALDNKSYSPLDYAMWGGFGDITELIISKGGKLGQFVLVGTLHDSAKNGLKNDVIKFLKARVGINERDMQGRIPLHWAVLNNHREITELLIYNRSDINSMDNDGQTPLDIATEQNHEILIELVTSMGGRTGKELIAAGFKRERPPGHSANIWEAAASGDLYGLEDFLERDIDIDSVNNAENQKGMTPLHYAAKYGRIKIVEILLKKEANFRIKDSNGRSTLHILCDSIPQTANSTSDSKSKLSIIENRTTVANWLVYIGSDINARDNYGNTPLHLAIHNGHDGMVSFLISRGANTLIRNSENKKPFDNHVSTTETATDKIPADQLHSMTISNTMAHLLRNAATNGQESEVVRFLASGVGINIPDNINGLTPLHCAVRGGHIDIVNLLLQQGADPDMITNDGWSPIHIAAVMGHLEIAKLLIASGANINCKIQRTWTPLDLAKQNQNDLMINLLIEKGGKRGTLSKSN